MYLQILSETFDNFGRP